MENCFTYGGGRVKMPEEGKNIIEFKGIDKQTRAPYTIYCDCEAIIKNIDEKDIHEISGFNITVVSPYEKTQYISHRGHDAGEVFMGKMEKLSDELYSKIKNANAEMIYTDKDKEKFKKAKKCHICEGALPNCSTKIDHTANIKQENNQKGNKTWGV